MMGSGEGDIERGPAAASPIVFLTIVIFAWGGNYTWVKLALEDSGPWAFNALRYALAVMFLGLALLFSGGRRALMPDRGERLPMAVIGVLQIAMMTGGTTIALQFIEASRTVLIAYSMPIWGMLLSFVILGERVTRPMAFGAALGLTGLALLCAPWSMDWTSRSAIAGSSIALTGTLAWALASVLYRRRKWRSPFWAQVFWQILAGAAVLVVAAPVFETESIDPTGSFVANVIYNALVPSILGFWCWARALDQIPVATASQILLLSPVFGVLLSAIVLGEPLTATILLSGLLVVAGAALSYLPTRRQVRDEP